MNNPLSLTNHFLIAMPQLADPNFFQSVTYICKHDEEGALGIIINQPTRMQLNDVFEQIDISSDDENINQHPVYFGGPVLQEQGFVLHRGDKKWGDTLFITDDIALTTSNDILHDIAINKGPKDYLLALGYAGWGSKQLEQEMAANAWLSVPADSDIIFNQPAEKRWHAAASLLGVDLNLLSEDIGHA